MEYVGIETQQSRNNIRTTLLLLMFPLLILGLVYAFFFIVAAQNTDPHLLAFDLFIEVAPAVMIGVSVWFLIAYLFNTSIIQSATNSESLDRKENKRVYNLVENLCMSQGMEMPQINVIEDDALNAFASGINKKSYTVTLTRGIIDRLSDAELEGVIAHELTHIRNRDVRLLVVSIVFVGIFTFISQMAVRMAFMAPRSSSKNNKGGGALILLLVAVLGLVGYFISTLLRFAISRKREFMADAGAAQMTKQPLALASALQKISTNSAIPSVKRDDVAQLFIEHRVKGFFGGMFATHPPIAKRIAVLEQF